jgi:ABC-2 type transport system ATP-binding protein
MRNSDNEPALETSALGKRYGKAWALRDCTLSLPAGRIVALVGPNGAGKTTLLHLATGLLQPTTGTVQVLGSTPARDAELLSRVSFVAQDVPLYSNFSVRDMLTLGERLNLHWDGPLARERLERLGIPLGQRVGSLSGGQRGQVALAIALAKQPEILLLDEPLASLDPLARREFLGVLMEGVTEHGTTVVLSSHLIADLERVCDFLVVLRGGRIAVAGEIEDLIRTHRMLTGPRRDGVSISGVGSVIDQTQTDKQVTMLVRVDGPIIDPSWSVGRIDLEEIVLGYLGGRTQPPERDDPELRMIRTEVGA